MCTLIKPETAAAAAAAARAGCIKRQVQFDWHKIYSMQFDKELLLAATLAASGNSGAGSNTTLDILI